MLTGTQWVMPFVNFADACENFRKGAYKEVSRVCLPNLIWIDNEGQRGSFKAEVIVSWDAQTRGLFLEVLTMCLGSCSELLKASFWPDTFELALETIIVLEECYYNLEFIQNLVKEYQDSEPHIRFGCSLYEATLKYFLEIYWYLREIDEYEQQICLLKLLNILGRDTDEFILKGEEGLRDALFGENDISEVLGEVKRVVYLSEGFHDWEYTTDALARFLCYGATKRHLRFTLKEFQKILSDLPVSLKLRIFWEFPAKTIEVVLRGLQVWWIKRLKLHLGSE